MKDPEQIDRLAWTLISMNAHIDDIRSHWARALGVSGPQWLIVVALQELDQGDGAPVGLIAKKLHVNPSFVTSQSGLLEKKGFLRRRKSTADARIVQLALTDKAYKELAKLKSKQDELNSFILQELDNGDLDQLLNALDRLSSRLAKARIKVAADS